MTKPRRMERSGGTKLLGNFGRDGYTLVFWQRNNLILATIKDRATFKMKLYIGGVRIKEKPGFFQRQSFKNPDF